MYHLWVKMIDLIFVILFGTIILITRIKNKPIVRNYRISKIDIHFNRKLHRWQVSWEVKYQLLVHRVPDKLLIDRLLGTVEILTHVSHDNKRKHCGVDCLVKSRKVKRNYAKTQLPCTLGGVSRNIFMETIRLANFSCMYINVRFVTIASRDCPFLKASKRLNFLISSRMKRTFLVRWRKISPDSIRFIFHSNTLIFLFISYIHSMLLLYWLCSRCYNNQSNREYPSVGVLIVYYIQSCFYVTGRRWSSMFLIGWRTWSTYTRFTKSSRIIARTRRKISRRTRNMKFTRNNFNYN